MGPWISKRQSDVRQNVLSQVFAWAMCKMSILWYHPLPFVNLCVRVRERTFCRGPLIFVDFDASRPIKWQKSFPERGDKLAVAYLRASPGSRGRNRVPGPMWPSIRGVGTWQKARMTSEWVSRAGSIKANRTFGVLLKVAEPHSVTLSTRHRVSVCACVLFEASCDALRVTHH